jgi:hypothetical protein
MEIHTKDALDPTRSSWELSLHMPRTQNSTGPAYVATRSNPIHAISSAGDKKGRISAVAGFSRRNK